MPNNIKLTTGEIEKQYDFIKKYHEKFLKKFNVKLPNLYDNDKKFTKNGLVLVYLSIG